MKTHAEIIDEYINYAIEDMKMNLSIRAKCILNEPTNTFIADLQYQEAKIHFDHVAALIVLKQHICVKRPETE